MSFKDIQIELATAIRKPDSLAPFDKRRLAVYQELFFNNIEGFCASSFPVLKSVVPEEQWQQLIREFFIQHSCESPHFIEISQEFIAFLSNSSDLLPWPWILELAHYEWVELACSVAASPRHTDIGYEGFDLEQGLDSQLAICVPETSWPLAYQYPVHTISESNCTNVTATPTHLVVYRDENFNVQFISTDALTIYLLQFIQTDAVKPLDSVLNYLVAPPLAIPEQQAREYLQTAIPQLLARQIIYTTKNKS